MGSFVEELLKTLAQEVIKKGYDKWSQRKPKMDVCVNCPNCGKAMIATMRSIEKNKLLCPGCKTDLTRDTMREQAQQIPGHPERGNSGHVQEVREGRFGHPGAWQNVQVHGLRHAVSVR